VTTPTAEDQLEGLAAVENLMQVLDKGMRAIQLYLPNNPVYQRAVANIDAAFVPVWEHCTEIELQVAETTLVWEGKPVLSQESKSDSMAWVLYKDGVRSITLVSGVEDDEIVRFLQVIQKARTLDQEASDDLMTLLWDQDFQSIRYTYVEIGMEDVPQLEKSDQEPQAKPEEVRREVEEEAPEERPEGMVSVEDFDTTLYFLDQKEIAYLKAEIEREYQQDLRGNVLSMLFDLLELQTYSTVRAELLSIVENFIPYLLGVGDFHSVAYILREIRVVTERARELLPEHRKALADLPAKLSEKESLGQLLQTLDEAVVHPTEEELGELFRELQPQALGSVLSWLPRLTNERVRGLLYAAARRLAQAHPQELTQALEAEDEDVLTETVGLIKELRLPPVVPALGTLLDRATPRVRRATVDALTAIASPGALQQLEKALEDDDREVRIRAVRAIGSHGYRQAFPIVEAVISGRKLKGADLTERTAFFETYGMLAGPDGLKTLKAMLEPRGLLRKKEVPEIRACAAMAIGKIRSSDAREVLARNAGDKDPLVRNAVGRALKEND